PRRSSDLSSSWPTTWSTPSRGQSCPRRADLAQWKCRPPGKRRGVDPLASFAARESGPLGYGVIGSTTDSGSVSLGSSPGTPAAIDESAFDKISISRNELAPVV